MRAHVGDVVEVVWRDSMRIDHGWASAADYRAFARLWASQRTAGYLLDRTKDHILIALSMSVATHHATTAMSIPREAVRCLRVIQRSNKAVGKALR